MLSIFNCYRDRLFIVFLSFATLCFLLIAGSLLFISQKSFDAISDAPEYTIVGKMILEGAGSKCYDVRNVVEMRHRLFPRLRERSIAVISPPPALILFIPLGLLDEKTLRAFYLPFSAVILAFSILMLRQTFRLNIRNGLLLLAGSAINWPLFETLRIGQITPILLFSLCVATYLFRADLAVAGIFALSLFIIKPQYLLPFVVYLFGAGKYRLIALGSAIIFLLVLVALSFMGVGGFERYLELIFHLGTLRSLMVPEISPTIMGQLLRLPGVPQWLVSTTSTAAVLGTLIFSFLLGKKVQNKISNANLIVLWIVGILPLTLLTASSCHSYDLTLLIPSVVAILSRAIGVTAEKNKWFDLLGFLCVFLFSIPIAVEFQVAILRGLVLNPFFFLLLAYSIFTAWLGWHWVVSQVSEKSG